MYIPEHSRISSFVRQCVLAGCLLVIAAGCDNGGTRGELLEVLDKLRLEKTQLTRRLEQSGKEAKQRKKQVQVLSSLSPEVRLENLCNLQRIKIHRYTNIYDNDKDGKKEKLIVYIQPIDEEGDIVKFHYQDHNGNDHEATAVYYSNIIEFEDEEQIIKIMGHEQFEGHAYRVEQQIGGK